MKSLTSIGLLREIAEESGGEFSSYKELEDKMSEVLSKYDSELPPGFTCEDLFEWGRMRQYITVTQNYGLRISLEGPQTSRDRTLATA
jgi:hypothetical protein